MLENIKNAIYQNISELFASATLDEMTGDFPAYKKKLKAIASIAEILGIDTEVISVIINIKTGKTIIDVGEPNDYTNEPGTGVRTNK